MALRSSRSRKEKQAFIYREKVEVEVRRLFKDSGYRVMPDASMPGGVIVKDLQGRIRTFYWDTFRQRVAFMGSKDFGK